ncbi:MAG: dethiobiotin synthase [Desulfuromonadales bacterium]|nr:dethiobiotin synthase [Desulfuromonadales bacterium]
MRRSRPVAAESPTGRGIFVTGTDTGVGKTLVTAALALFLRRQGIDVGVMKPAETGVAAPDGAGADAALLSWAAQSHDPLELLSPYRFKAPLAPAMAAEQEGRKVDFSALVQTARTLAARHELLLVEGAGGLMVPLAGGLMVADLARELGFSLLVVSRPQLGTINHTALTVFAARTMQIPLAGVIVSGMPANPAPAEASAPHDLASFASADLLAVLPLVAGDDRQKVEALANAIAQLPTLPWLLAALGVNRQPGIGASYGQS